MAGKNKNRNKNRPGPQGGSIAGLTARHDYKFGALLGYLHALAFISNRVIPGSNGRPPTLDQAIEFVKRRIAWATGTSDPEIPDNHLALGLYVVGCQRMMRKSQESVLLTGRTNDATTPENPISIFEAVPSAPAPTVYMPVASVPTGGSNPPPPVDTTPHWYEQGGDANVDVTWWDDIWNGGGFNWGRS